MTTAVRTPPQHGERACYLRGCRRPECSNANYRYMSRYRLDREHGQQRHVDATPAADHVRVLINAGWNLRQIGDAAGCAHRVIADLAHRRQTTVKPTTADGILAINPYPAPEPAQYIDATGTMRRIRALVAIGYTNRELAAAIGIWPANLGRIARGELTQVWVTTAKTTAAVYRDLSRRPGTSQKARDRARQEGWHGPMAWDDIDDPNCQPEIEELTADDTRSWDQLSRNELAAVRREWIQKLTDQAYLPAEIAERLGMNTNSVRAIVQELRTGVKRDRTPKAAVA